jgi:hypothetical protein
MPPQGQSSRAASAIPDALPHDPSPIEGVSTNRVRADRGAVSDIRGLGRSRNAGLEDTVADS